MSTITQTHSSVRPVAAEMRRWLAGGDLQSPGGAFCAWHDAATGRLAFEYPEITGYALTWLAGRESPTPHELEAAGRAADWLVHRLSAGKRCGRDGWDGGAVYTFDLGMIAAGLISFGARFGQVRYVTSGRELAAQLAGYVHSARGLEAIAPDGPATSRGSGWSTTGRPHLVKCVQALLLAGETEAADLLAEATMATQREDGAFPTQPQDDQLVMLHPHLYTVEGLWMWGLARDRDDALEAARRGAAFAWEHQLPAGGLPRFAGGAKRAVEQLDVTSQAVRAAVFTGLEPIGLGLAVARLARVAVPTEAGAALVYQPSCGQVHLNAWVTMFGVQALMLANDANAVGWKDLV